MCPDNRQTVVGFGRLQTIFILFFCALILVPESLSGATVATADSSAMDTLHEVRVYGRRPLATVQSIRGTDLQALSSTSVADALKYFAGVQIKDYGGLGGLKTVNVRSLGAQHVGVYIDGVRVTNAQNGTVDLGKYSLSTMESVDLYNANRLNECQSASEYASGATVYLQTRRPENDSLAVQLRRASFSTWMAKANGQLSKKKWQAFIDVEGLTSRGDYPFRYKSEYEDTVGRRTNSDIKYIRAEGAAFNGGFSSHIYYYYSERGCPGGIVRRLSDKYTNVGREWDGDFFVQASYKRSIGKHRLMTNAKYTNEYLRYCTDYPENQNTAKVNNHYRQEDVYAAASYAFVPWNWLSINAGYDFRYSRLKADLKFFKTVERFDQKQVLALRANWHGLNLAASVLHQHYKDHTVMHTGAADPLDRFTPSVTLGYAYKTLNVRAGYKKIFRAPTLNDLYYTQTGNRNLKPEYTTQWNIGAEYQFATRSWSFSAQADAYINEITNRIVCLPLKGTYTWSMMNYGYTFCRGLNGNFTCGYTYRDWRFSGLASLTLQRDLNRTDPEDEDTYNKPICYSPTLSYGLTGIASWRTVSLTVSDLHVSSRMWSYADAEDILKPYNNIDMKLSFFQDIPHGPGLGLTLEINDLLNEQYEHIPRYPMPGRNYRLTLTFTL